MQTDEPNGQRLSLMEEERLILSEEEERQRLVLQAEGGHRFRFPHPTHLDYWKARRQSLARLDIARSPPRTKANAVQLVDESSLRTREVERAESAEKADVRVTVLLTTLSD